MSTFADCTLTVNGVQHTRRVDSRLSLADFLRDELSLTGTHLGCEQGVCGVCSVLLDGRNVRACLLLAVQAQGHEVVTIEGLRDAPDARRLADAMGANHALQCGFCTPGFMVAAVDYLRSGRCGDEDEVRDALSGNICRCTGYQGIVAAVLAAGVAVEPGDPENAGG
jgi:aerobic carbon-monoxide dehydrogenase small subunit